jgi:hypothetical protein
MRASNGGRQRRSRQPSSPSLVPHGLGDSSPSLTAVQPLQTVAVPPAVSVRRSHRKSEIRRPQRDSPRQFSISLAGSITEAAVRPEAAMSSTRNQLALVASPPIITRCRFTRSITAQQLPSAAVAQPHSVSHRVPAAPLCVCHPRLHCASRGGLTAAQSFRLITSPIPIPFPFSFLLLTPSSPHHHGRSGRDAVQQAP